MADNQKNSMAVIALLGVIAIAAVLNLFVSPTVSVNQQASDSGASDSSDVMVATDKDGKLKGTIRGIEENTVFLPEAARIKENYVGEGAYVKKDGDLVRVELSDGSEVRVKSPTRGNVYNIEFQNGEIVNSSDVAAYSVIDEESYIVELFIGESRLLDFEVSEEVAFTIPAISNTESIIGTVSYVSPAPVTTQGSESGYRVTITADELPDNVKYGMIAVLERF